MPSGDLILKNANVITGNGRPSTANLVAIKDNRIWLVARTEELASASSARTRVIDCNGKTVVPGFNDAHLHLFSLVRKLTSLDLSSLNSISEIKLAISRKAQNTPPGQWVTATSYNDFYLSEKRHPNRWDIDEIAPHHPVVLTHRSLHACVLNSLALSLAGITRETAEPAGGLIDRDLSSGEPNGLLFEMLGYIRERVMPPLSDTELEEGIALANQCYLSQGITSLQEATTSNGLSQWQKFCHLKETGKLKSRLSVMHDINALNQFQEAGLVSGTGDSELRLGGVKVILSEATGRLHPSPPELNQQLLDAHQAGFQLAIHAVTPSEVEAAITALEYIHHKFPKASPRYRIEHCSECPPHLLERLIKLPVVVVTQPPFLYFSGERYLATLPPERLKWLYRINSWQRSGVTVAGSSDSPVVASSPLVGIYAAVTRRAKSGQQLLIEEGISANQALAMYTTNAAYASYEENIKGTITPGKLADMVVLSHNPLEVAPEEIKDIKVEMTIIDGKIVWEA